MPTCHGGNVESAASSTNVETLARALARSSARLALMPDEAERSRLAGALASIASYIDLLGSLRTTYALKLELGAVSYLALVSAEQGFQQASVALAQARSNRLADTAALFQSLAGNAGP